MVARIAGGRSAHEAITEARFGSVELSGDEWPFEREMLADLLAVELEVWLFPEKFTGSSNPRGVTCN